MVMNLFQMPDTGDVKMTPLSFFSRQTPNPDKPEK
jgi:hypothetical protein